MSNKENSWKRCGWTGHLKFDGWMIVEDEDGSFSLMDYDELFGFGFATIEEAKKEVNKQLEFNKIR